MAVRRHHALSLAAGLLSIGALPSAEEFPASDVTQLWQVPLNAFPSNPASGNDCWGYVSPSGREYALMGLTDAVGVVDITDSSGPVLVGTIDHQGSTWCDIRTFGTVAYAVNETGGGLDVIDLSQVDQGIVTLVQRVTDLGLETCHNISVNVESATLYLCAPNINQGRLVAMDLTDPLDPTIAGMVDVSSGAGVPHDATVVTYESGPYAGREIAFCSSGTDGLEIYDVTNKSSMFLVSVAAYPNFVFTHQAWLSDDLQLLYVNDELDSVNETVIFDVSNILDPTYVTAYSSGVDATDHNLFVHQGRIFEADNRAGLRIFDATNPLAPVEDGWIDTFPGDDSEGSGGAWGVYPFFPSGKVIISDRGQGLVVVWPGPPPLSIAFASGAPPERIHPHGDSFPVVIQAAAGEVLDVTSPTLVYDLGNGPIERPMAPLGGDLFDASFGPTLCGSIVQFYVRAATVEGIPVRLPASSPCDSSIAVSAAGTVTVLDDDFEGDNGWIVGAPGDMASTGLWLRSDPIGTSSQPENDRTSGLGSTCFFTGQGTVNGGVGDQDVDGGQTSLTSPAFDLSASSKATIAYWRWYDNSYSQLDADEGIGPNEDVFDVMISDDGGATWVLVERIGPSGSGTSGGWILHSFDVGSVVDLTSTMRLRFVASDFGLPSVVEAAIDDVLVIDVTCPGVPAVLLQPPPPPG